MTVICPGPGLEASSIGAGSVLVIAGIVEHLVLLSFVGAIMVIGGVMLMRRFYRKYKEMGDPSEFNPAQDCECGCGGQMIQDKDPVAVMDAGDALCKCERCDEGCSDCIYSKESE